MVLDGNGIVIVLELCSLALGRLGTLGLHVHNASFLRGLGFGGYG